MSGDAIRLWLIGADVSASPSSAMHTAALHGAGLTGSYDLVSAQPEELPGLLRRMRNGEVRGANVTKPYKAALAAACDRLDGDAAVCGVVNTITAENGELIGENTDVQGFELGLSVHRLWVAPGASVVIVGAGGAATGIALAVGRVADITVAVTARRPAQIDEVAERLDGIVPVLSLEWGSAPLREAVAAADLVVNATPVGLEALPFVLDDLGPRTAIADVRYRPRPVDLVTAALNSGRPACDGLEMLLYQGMLSFQRWTGAEPPWPAARAALREAVSA